MLHPSLSHLENIDPRFLDPNTSFVVMSEDAENDLDDARLALDGLVWIMDSSACMNKRLRKAGLSNELVELPFESLSALMRLVRDKIQPATNNPTLGAVQELRPDLFQTNLRGA